MANNIETKISQQQQCQNCRNLATILITYCNGGEEEFYCNEHAQEKLRYVADIRTIYTITKISRK
ncbi:MAG: hypothetical protein QXQ79_02150 [Candidatus Nanoarchaeia archaeon]